MVVSVSRNEYLCRKEDHERHVIFLDIDGVLQPCNSQKRFEHDIAQTQIDVAKLMKDDAYLELERYDIAAVYYDWSERAVGNLKKLLSDCDAEIVISSDWKRTKSLEQLRLLFRIHQLDEYITDVLSYSDYSFKKDEIREYLQQHPSLATYVILDDLNMEKEFRGYMICTGGWSYLTEQHVYEAERILKYGPWWSDYYRNKILSDGMSQSDLIYDHYKKVIFLDIDGVLNNDGKLGFDKSPIIDRKCVYYLNEIIKNTGAEIVLSSSWRSEYERYAYEGFVGKNVSMEILLEELGEYEIRIAGATPILFNGPEGRPFEIRSWLYRRPQVESFVILDDDTFWQWNWLEPYFVCTTREYGEGYHEWEKGLTEECAKKAIAILNGTGDKRFRFGGDLNGE